MKIMIIARMPDGKGAVANIDARSFKWLSTEANHEVRPEEYPAYIEQVGLVNKDGGLFNQWFPAPKEEKQSWWNWLFPAY